MSQKYTNSFDEDSDPNFKWTLENEVLLLSAMFGLKPIGAHKHAIMAKIMANIRQLGLRATTRQVWQKIRQWYNCQQCENAEHTTDLTNSKRNMNISDRLRYKLEMRKLARQREEEARRAFISDDPDPAGGASNDIRKANNLQREKNSSTDDPEKKENKDKQPKDDTRLSKKCNVSKEKSKDHKKSESTGIVKKTVEQPTADSKKNGSGENIASVAPIVNDTNTKKQEKNLLMKDEILNAGPSKETGAIRKTNQYKTGKKSSKVVFNAREDSTDEDEKYLANNDKNNKKSRGKKGKKSRKYKQ